ncbi:TLC domain-containing protein 4-B isoform X2 [Embiotoca jacksoni]|uniref:TLC domain-containing protein 4-B isoform X2 n=1 Tax=Embiotoca jacksoni TaxID=100190 RepID=UPI0037047A73
MDPFSQLIFTISVTSFLTFQWLFHKVSPWMSMRISPGFLGLSDKQQVEWNSRGDPTLVKINVAITTGYLISDLLLIFYYWKAIGDKFFVVHHLAALYAYYYVLGQGMLPYFANFRLLAEFSTPCVNQRWFFEVLGYPKSSRPNMANGVAMAVVFFMVRIAVMPVYYSRMCAVYGTEAFYLVAWGGRVAWICSSICLDIMNIMWMHKIARGCYKVLRSASQSKAGTPQENGKTD